MDAKGEKKLLKVGSRKSKLALIQTNHVIERLKDYYGDDKYEFEIITMNTTGDNILNTPLAEIGSKALFTKELEEALLNNEIDFIVHSMKDMPTTLPRGCCIGAVLKREDPNDVLILKKSFNVEHQITSLTDLLKSSNNKNGSFTIGTSSYRRIAQLKYYNPGVQCINIRGNLTTRFQKLDDPDSNYTALMLAAAGVQRSGYEDRITETLDSDDWFYAVGQGALAIECREEDRFILDLLTPIFHFKTCLECISERSLMKLLEGGCSVPIGVRCKWEFDGDENPNDKHYSIRAKLWLSGAVFSLDGTKKVEHTDFVDLNEDVEESETNFTNISLPSRTLPCFEKVKRQYRNSYKLGYMLSKSLREKGAVDILNEIKQSKQKVL